MIEFVSKLVFFITWVASVASVFILWRKNLALAAELRNLKRRSLSFILRKISAYDLIDDIRSADRILGDPESRLKK